MTDKNLVEIVAVVDRSGSMGATKEKTIEAIGGFNAFLKEQQELPGKANLTLVLFDHEYILKHDGVDIQDVQPFDEKTYVPRGMTALLDAVGRTVDDVGKRLADTPDEERPWRVIFCVLTDGMENASHDYTKSRVQEMVKHQEEKYGWKFQYLAAGLDAFHAADLVGMQGSAQQFSNDAQGTQRLYAAAASYTSSMRYDDDDDDESSGGSKWKHRS